MRIVLTGPSGSGKSAVCNELEKLRHKVVEEPARTLILYFKKYRPEYLPWNNREKFQKSVEERTINDWLENTDGFFDRSLVDEIAFRKYYNMDTTKTYEVCKTHRYDLVFMFPPWKEIYVNDEARVESFETSSDIYNHLVDAYKTTGYDVINVPKVSIKERVNFILEYLK